MMRRQRAFTLVELMIVLMIISILAAMLFPVFARARESARKTNCLSSIAQLSVALQMYAVDWQGNFPPKDNDWTPVYPYTKSAEVFRCPSDARTRAEDAPRPPEQQYDTTPVAPGPAEQPRILDSSYVYRSGLASDGRATEIVAFDKRVWHMGGRNVAFLDAHAKWYMAEALWQTFSPQLLALDPVFQSLSADEQKRWRETGTLGDSAPWRR